MSDAVSRTCYSNPIVGGFTKLFSTIVHSTVWREDMHVKVVWVTMLAMADRNGRVWASVPGLADASRVSIQQCREALAILSKPDPDSRTKAHEGRRIQDIDGGWQLLNYLKYREMRDDDERRLQTRQAVARFRERQKANVSHGKPRKPMKAQAEAEAEADKIKTKSTRRASRSARVDDPTFNRFWSEYPNHAGKVAAQKAWSKLNPDAALCEAISASVAWQRQQPQWTKDGGAFVPHGSTWLNQRRFEDERPTAMTPKLSKLAPDWRAECAEIHNGRCTNSTFHEAVKGS